MSSPSFVSKVSLTLSCIACCAICAYAGYSFGIIEGFNDGRAYQYQIDAAAVRKMLGVE